MGSRDPEGPEGRRLREEAGLAHRRRPRGSPVLPQRSTCRTRAQTRTVPGQFPFVRGSGSGWEIAQDAEPGPTRSAPTCCTKPARTPSRNWAIALAAGVERLAQLREAAGGRSRREIEFVFAVGSNYFFEIAKLRAARLLWAQAVAAFGPADAGACRMSLHVRTPRLNKSVYDPLHQPAARHHRSALGRDRRLRRADRRALRLRRAPRARTSSAFCQEEAHLDAVADPAGGSYYIEALTDSLAREAWKLFQQVEAEGGYAEALAAGSIGKALAETRAAREKAVSVAAASAGGRQQLSRPDGEDAGSGARRRRRRSRPSRSSAWPSRSRRSAQRTARHATRDRPLPEGAAAEARRRQDARRARQLLPQLLRLRRLRHRRIGRIRRQRTPT